MLSRHQDTKTRQGGSASFALLACLDGSCLLGRMDGSYAWIGSEIQFRIVKKHPKVWKKSNFFNSIRYNTIRSYLCYINPYSWEREHFHIFLFKIIFQEILFTFIFHFQVQYFWSTQSTSREDDTGGFLRNSMLRFSSIKYSMLGWFQNHHTCSGRALLVSPPCFFTNRIGLSFSPQERACRATRCVRKSPNPKEVSKESKDQEFAHSLDSDKIEGYSDKVRRSRSFNKGQGPRSQVQFFSRSVS